MKKKLLAIISAIKHWLWDVPTAKPPKEQPVRLKATEVAKEWMVIHYRGQRVPMRDYEYPMWKAMSRNDKRAMAKECERQEKKGLLIFQEVEGKTLLIRNLDYEKRAEKLKATK